MKKFLISTALLLLVLSSCANDTPDIGIIGGADGPTAIVVGSKVDDENTFDEMPADELSARDGIPVPPGRFESAWKNPDTGELHITTRIEERVELGAYVGETLIDAGFNSTWSKVEPAEEGGFAAEYHRNENDRYTVSTTLIDDVLMIDIAEK